MTADQAERIQAILDNVSFPGYTIKVHYNRHEYMVGQDARVVASYAYMQGSFQAPCNDTGVPETHKTRKWLLSPFMTDSEVVQTALKLVLTSVEHEAREQFRYKGKTIFGPHLDVEQLLVFASQPDHKDKRHDNRT